LRLVVVHHLEQRRVTEAAFQFQRFDQSLERQILMRLSAERGFLDRTQQVVDRVCPSSWVRSTWVLTKKPISPSISPRLRLAIGTPTRMSVWPV
jgi:hypothetical protein